MHYDFEVNMLDNRHIIELIEFDEQQVVDCVKYFLENDIEKSKIETYKNEKDNITWDNEWCYIKLDKYVLTGDDSGESFANNVVEIIKALL